MRDTGYKDLTEAIGQLLLDVQGGLFSASLAAKCLRDLHEQARLEVQGRLALPISTLQLSSEASQLCQREGIYLVKHLAALSLDKILSLGSSPTVHQEMIEGLKRLELSHGMDVSA